MQATLPPAWAQAERLRRRRGRVALAELGELTARAHQLHLQMTLQELRRLRELHARLDWTRARPDLLLYTPSQLRQLVRLGTVAESASPAPGWRPGPLGAPWHLPDTDPSPETLSAGGAGGAGGAGSAGVAGGAEWRSWRGWGAGALLLVAALLLVRATDRCFTRNYASARRRRSEEWPTPNVLATSQEANPASSSAAEAEAEAEVASYIVCMEDLPPPYAEVADAKREEPPPPYSDCYVAFRSGGAPSVHFYNAQRQSLFDRDEPTSSRFSSLEEVSIAHSSNHFNMDPAQDNPIGSRIEKIPYADSTSADTASEGGEGEVGGEGEDVGEGEDGGEEGRAPLATENMRVATHAEDDDVSYISITDVVEAHSSR